MKGRPPHILLEIDRLHDRDKVTRLMSAIREGHVDAERTLFPLIYDELHEVAKILMETQKPGHTLQATALVNEAYLRLVGVCKDGWNDRKHFLRVAAKAMRSVLIDYARKQLAGKRSSGWRRFPLEEAAVFTRESSLDILMLNWMIRWRRWWSSGSSED